VKFGKINATLPQDVDPQAVTIDEAIALIATKSGVSKKPAAKKRASKKASKTKKAKTTAEVATD